MKSLYEKILQEEYAKWSYSPRISKAIREEVEGCRNHAAIFDLSSFGKVSNTNFEVRDTQITQRYT